MWLLPCHLVTSEHSGHSGHGQWQSYFPCWHQLPPPFPCLETISCLGPCQLLLHALAEIPHPTPLHAMLRGVGVGCDLFSQNYLIKTVNCGVNSKL